MKRPSTTAHDSLPIKRQELEILSSIPTFNSLLEAFSYVCGIFPSNYFSPPIPPFVLKNQLYALTSSRTRIDKELNTLLSDGALRALSLFDDEFSVVIMRTSDYEHSLFSNETSSSKELINKFMEYVRKACPRLTVTRESIQDSFTDKDIRISLDVHGERSRVLDLCTYSSTSWVREQSQSSKHPQAYFSDLQLDHLLSFLHILSMFLFICFLICWCSRSH